MDSGWEAETALDVDMVSAGCPLCNILVIQADAGALDTGVRAAAAMFPDSISASWGSVEGGGEAAREPTHDHPGIGVFAASGDNAYDSGGSGPEYPATSAYVVGVGGTKLDKNPITQTFSESAWSLAGSSCSKSIPAPTYQPANATAVCAMRVSADVAADADPSTGVAVYEADAGGWLVVGGTSAATPLVAALMAGAGHGDITPDFVYRHPEAFQDVTTGNNGSCGNALCDAGSGWDGPTGLGSPNQAVIAMIGGGSDGPSIAITSPGSGASEDPGFAMSVDVGSGAVHVDLAVDDVRVATFGAPFSISVPSNVATGSHDFKLTAYDGDHNSQATTIRIEVTDGGCSATGSPMGIGLALLVLASSRRAAAAAFSLSTCRESGDSFASRCAPPSSPRASPWLSRLWSPSPSRRPRRPPPRLPPPSMPPSRRACRGDRCARTTRASRRCWSMRRARSSRAIFPSGLGAGDIESAYNIDTTLGTGITVAVVDAFGYAAIESDLATYRSTFGLPPCTIASGCLTVVNDNGQTTPLPADNTDWIGETALDVDMVSAACPMCKIVVVQAGADGNSGLDIGQMAAVKLGVNTISDSWGGPEDSGTGQEDPSFNNAGIGTFAAAGDDGFNQFQMGEIGPSYPSTSTYVIAVGGTTLTTNPGAGSGVRPWDEIAWSDGGSSCSTQIPKPPYQPASAACNMRAASDVSAAADGGTQGIATFIAKQGGWMQVDGTSAASPITAALFAGAGHGDALPAFIYKHPSAFLDITVGTNGSCQSTMCDAGGGWDGPTGMGTPNQALIKAIGGGSDGPSVTFTYPNDGDTVATGFTMQVMPDTDAQWVEIDVDGVKVGAVNAAPYQFPAPMSLTNGAHMLTAIAYDIDHNSSSSTINITVGAVTGGDDDSNDSQSGCAAGGNSAGGALLLGAIGLVVRRRKQQS